MSMSRDRVHFRMPSVACMSTIEASAYLKAASDAFSMSDAEVRSAGDKIIVCRPSQFARFLIYRHQMGGRNSFKLLDPVLVQAQPDRSVDVSGRPRKEGVI